MKRKKFIISSLAVLVLLSSTTVFAVTRGGIIDPRIEAIQKNDKQQITNKATLSPEAKAKNEKIDKMLEAAWNDIKSEYEIDEQQYTIFNMDNLSTLLTGEVEKFSDKDYLDKIRPMIEQYVFNAPKYSTSPVILVKNDKSEIIVAYKDNDGNNILKKANKVNDEWVKTEEIKKGDPKLSTD